MKRILFFAYGVISYALGVATLVYLIAFLGDFMVPKTIDGTPGLPLWQALMIDLALVVMFGLQHSGMARKGFKKFWSKVIPEPIERSTFVLFTFFALGTLMLLWQPIGGEIWKLENGHPLYGAMYVVSFAGWALLLWSTFLINHFDLFGLRQVYLNLVKKPYTSLQFKERGIYKSVRHPIYTGLLMGTWFTPHMTISHFAIAMFFTTYIFYAITLEEKDLINQWGNRYREYMSRTGKVLPKVFRRKSIDPLTEPADA